MPTQRQFVDSLRQTNHNVIMVATRIPIIEQICDITLQIIHCFCSERQTPLISDDCYIDIELLAKDKNSYYIRVTNYNGNSAHMIQNNPIIPLQKILSSFLSLVATKLPLENCLRNLVFAIKGEKDVTEQIYEFKCVDNSCTCLIIDEQTSEYFVHKNNYLSVRLECDMPSSNILMFRNLVIAELQKLDQLENNWRYIFRSEDQIFWRNRFQVRRVIGSCRLLSVAVTTVCEHSRNQRFKEKCLRIIRGFENSRSSNAILEQILWVMCQKYHNNRRGRGSS